MDKCSAAVSGRQCRRSPVDGTWFCRDHQLCERVWRRSPLSRCVTGVPRTDFVALFKVLCKGPRSARNHAFLCHLASMAGIDGGVLSSLSYEEICALLWRRIYFPEGLPPTSELRRLVREMDQDDDEDDEELFA